MHKYLLLVSTLAAIRLLPSFLSATNNRMLPVYTGRRMLSGHVISGTLVSTGIKADKEPKYRVAWM